MNAVVVGIAIATLSLACSDVPETGQLPSSAGHGGALAAGGITTSGAGGAAGGMTVATQGGISGIAGAGSAGASSAAGAAGTAGAAGAAGAAGGTGPLDGAGLYGLHCKVCHEESGKGGALGPETQHPVRDWSTWVVRNGLPGNAFPKPMEPVKPDMLSDVDLVKIWDYLDQPPQPTTGQALYLDYCGNCHGADGKGGPSTRNILEELGELEDLVKKGAHPGEFNLRNEYMPSLNPSRLNDAEVDLIYAYVESL